MSLSHSQKNYIKKNIKRIPSSQIAKNLALPEERVLEYVKDHWRKEKFENFVKKENGKENKSFIFSFADIKSWIKQNKFFFLVLGVLVFISYANALNNNFVSDDHGIEINANLWDFNYLISKPFLVYLPHFIVYKIFGLNPFFFRLINFFFHLFSTFLVFLIVSLTTKKKIGFISSLIFASHPLLTESIVWISGVTYIQYSFFFLFSFLVYLLYRRNNDKKYYIFSLILFGFSTLSSEKASSLFLVFPFFEIYSKEFRKNWKRTIPYFLSSLIFVIFFLTSGKVEQRVTGLQSDYQETVGGMENPLIQIPIAISSYLELIFWPSGLTLYHSEMGFTQLEFGIRFLIFAGLLGYIIYCFKRGSIIFFWLSFFLIGLLPTLTPFRISWIVAERYVYFSTLGIFAVLAMGFERLARIKDLKMIVYTVFALIILALSVRTIARNIDWQNEDNLWIATGKTSPSSHNTHNNLGDVYGRQGDLNKAAYEFKKAIEIKPNYADAYHNLANTYRNMGKVDDAIKNYEQAVHFNPRLWQSYQNLGAIYFYKKDIPKAVENFNKAISIYPQNPDLWTGTGLIYFESDKNKAKKMFLKALSIDPNNARAKAAMKELIK